VANRELSSLDRFLTNRAPILAGIVNDARTLAILRIVGAVYGAVGLASLAAAPLTSQDVFAAMAVPFLACAATMVGITAVVRARLRLDSSSQARLSREAAQLVRQLLSHLHGWPLTRRMRRLRFRRLMGKGILRSMHDRRSEDVLTPEAFRVLEAAAREFNRIHAALGSPGSRPSALERLAPNVRAAADETMAELLHVGAVLNSLPEASGAHEDSLQARIAELRELAERTESLGASVAAPSVAAEGSGTRIQELLAGLRAEEEAREELRVGRE
jgi:hypothetical protein